MKNRSIALALLVALAPATFPVSAVAQAPSDDTTTAMARARFKEGVEYYDKSEYEQARAAFLQAYALKKHPAVLLNLAWSCLKSGHALDAEKYFKQFLSEGRDITDKQRSDANEGLTQAHSKLGRIEITATPGTDVTVDGEKLGAAPIGEPIWVEAGAHTVKFRAPDGATDTQSVTVLGGERQVARYGKAERAAVATATPSPSNPPPETTTPPAPSHEKKADEPTETEPAPLKEKAMASTGGSPLTPPAHIWPAVALGSVALGSFIVAGVLAGSKNSAQTDANDTAAQIISHGGGAGTCQAPPQGFVGACNAYRTDLNDVNQDATAANVFLGVGIASLAAGIVYWVVADKGMGSIKGTGPIVTPYIGKSETGMALKLGF
jgi:hypothetical protein